MLSVERLFNIQRGDYPRLRALAPSFAITAACTVLLATSSKALFLGSNEVSRLPAVFLGAALLTALGSLAHVAAIQRFSLGARFRGLLLLAISSLLALRLAFPLNTSIASVVMVLWCPAVAQLLVMQTWGLVTLLPTRQGKRMLPVLAAVTTAGAALGGGLVQLALRFVGAEDLLIAGAVMLLWPLLRLNVVVRSLQDGGSRAPPTAAVEERPPRAIAGAIEDIRKTPLLTDLAWVVLLLQGASLVVDYQFSAELKPRFDQDAMAGFLGAFYAISNVVVLLFTLLATSRVLRVVGIGLAFGATAVVLGVGSVAYWLVNVLHLSASAFWVCAAMAFCERIAEYGITKPASQMVYMPLDQRAGEAAKTIINGVVYRVASAGVSLLLLLSTPTLAEQFRLSPAVVIATVAVVYFSLRITPKYRQALFHALKANRLDGTTVSYLRDGLGYRALAALREQLASSDSDAVLSALDTARELHLTLPIAQLEKLALNDDERVAAKALRILRTLELPLRLTLLRRLLDPERAPSALMAVLTLLRDDPPDGTAALVRPLAQHPDAAVASAAVLVRMRAAGEAQAGQFDDEVAQAQSRSAAERSRLTGMTRAGDFARELPALLRDGETPERLGAIAQMKMLGLPYFVDPLIGCLADGALRAATIKALAQYGADIAPQLRRLLSGGDAPLVTQVAALQIAAAWRDGAALPLLLTATRSSAETLRNHAADALWRRAADADLPTVDADTIVALAAAEVTRLARYAQAEPQLHTRPTAARVMFAAELNNQRVACEKRTFRFLGLLYDRDAIHRSFTNYRKSDARTRSNAIELLDQHVQHEQLRAFIPLIERSLDKHGTLRLKTSLQADVEALDLVALLSEHDPWLAQLWRWVRERGQQDDEELSWLRPLDRLILLQQCQLLSALTGQQLLAFADEMDRRQLRTGRRIVEEGEGERWIGWLLRGAASVHSANQQVATLSTGDCFGEVAAIDGGVRVFTVETTKPSVMVSLSARQFVDALDLSPRLLHALVRRLSGHLRSSIHSGSRVSWAQPLLDNPQPTRPERTPTSVRRRGKGERLMRAILRLRGISLFHGLSAEDLLLVANVSRERSYPAGQDVCRLGEPGEELFALASGAVQVLRDQVVLATLGPGEYFGEMALLEQSPRSATVRTTEETRFVVLTRDAFTDLLELSPPLARNVARVLVERIRAAAGAPVDMAPDSGSA